MTDDTIMTVVSSPVHTWRCPYLVNELIDQIKYTHVNIRGIQMR